jgi:hypothetical protein
MTNHTTGDRVTFGSKSDEWVVTEAEGPWVAVTRLIARPAVANSTWIETHKLTPWAGPHR